MASHTLLFILEMTSVKKQRNPRYRRSPGVSDILERIHIMRCRTHTHGSNNKQGTHITHDLSMRTASHKSGRHFLRGMEHEGRWFMIRADTSV